MLNKIVKNKKYKRIVLAIILLTTVLSMVIIGYSNASNTQYEDYDYSRGDTIWQKSDTHNRGSGVAIQNNMTYIVGDKGIEKRYLNNGSLVYRKNAESGAGFGPVINKYTFAYGYENFVVRDTDGSLVWIESSSLSYYESSPVIKNGYIYYMRPNGNIRKATVRNNGTEWVKEGLVSGLDGWQMGDISIDENYVFVPMKSSVYILNKSNGDLVYKKTITPSDYTNVEGGGISINNNFYIGAEDGEITSINLSTGNINWETNIDGSDISSLTYENDVLYGGSQAGNTFAINLNGNILWKNSKTNKSHEMYNANTMPVITDNYVYIGGYEGYAVIYDKKTGDHLYTFDTPDGYYRMDEAIANGYYVYWEKDTSTLTAKATGNVSESAIGISRRNANFGFDSNVEPQTVNTETTYNVYGNVTNKSTALQRATVEAYQNNTLKDSVTTNSTGMYTLNIPNGTTKLVFNASKYREKNIQIEVSGKTKVRNITLIRNRISVRYGGCLEPNEETPYNLYFHGPNGVENDRPKSIVVNNNTVLSVSLLDGIINTTNEGTSNVTFTYEYNSETYSITEEIRVFNNSIENLHNRQGTCKFIAFTGDEIGGQSSNVQWIILSIFFGIVTSYGFRNKWVGLVAIQLLITIGWFMNFLNSGIMLGSLFYALFISMATISAFKQRVNVNLPR